MADSHGRRIERRLFGRIKSQLEESLFRTVPHPPWYEQNRFMGSLSVFVSLLATVLAAVYGMRWLLIVALPFGVLATWIVASAISPARKALRYFALLLPLVIVGYMFWRVSFDSSNPKVQPKTEPVNDGAHREPPTTLDPSKS